MDRLPSLFTTMISDLLGNNAPAFFEAMSMSPAVSVKQNRRKDQNTPLSFTDKAGNHIPATPVKWCSSGLYLESRPAFTLDPRMHAGAYYVQDASSMIYETVVERLFDEGLLSNSPHRPLTVADLCAAPGGKTSSMINALPDSSVVLANEFVTQRAAILKENILKWGFPNTIITNSPVEKISAAGIGFDLVAVDAPCSGEGMMRKEEVAVSQWSPELVAKCVALQREILDNAVTMLNDDGILIYSTCTFNRLENEENVEYLITRHQLKPVDLDFPAEWGILPGIDAPGPCYRFMPHATRGEGLFLAVLRKPASSSCNDFPTTEIFTTSPSSKRQERRKGKISRSSESSHDKTPPAPDFSGYVAGRYQSIADGDTLRLESSDTQRLADRLKGKVKILSAGIPAARLKGRDWAPTVPLLLSTAYRHGSLPECRLPLDTTLNYLRHEAITLPPDTPTGFVSLIYNNLPVGLVKNIGTRANNLYPSEWRIRNL